MQLAAIILLTFRELWAKKIVIGLLIISTLIWVMLAFALNLDIVEGSLAGIRLFGQEATPGNATANEETGEVVRELITLDRIVIEVEKLVAGVAYWAGILLALFATASLLPSLLAKGRVDLLLSKPISRTALLGGHLVGVLLTMMSLAVYLFGMVWLVMSLKSGIWAFRFFWGMLVLIAMFGVMYSVVALIGVTTRSAPLALIVSYGLVIASMIFIGKDEIVPQINPPWRQVFLGFYHALPNFGEVTDVVLKLTGNEPVTTWYPFLSSIFFGIVIFAAAFFFFNRRDF